MTSGAEMSIFGLIAEASLVVQLVMLLLLAASVDSWAIIFRKAQMLMRGPARTPHASRSDFWSGGDLGALYRGIEARGEVGRHGEHLRSRVPRVRAPAPAGRQHRRRAARGRAARDEGRSRSRRSTALEHSLATLATVGSTSPYVGLFGTVWGIMSAFVGLGRVQQATLATVAPGIAEALVATAIGLFAAIPAVIAYNRFADQVGRLELRYDAFMEEFSTILQRHASRGPQGS